MPLDEMRPAESLVVEKELTRVEKQNKYGMKSLVVPGIPANKHETVLIVETDSEISVEEYYAIYEYLKTNHRVSAMQTAFSVPNVSEEGHNADLHLSAHLRYSPIPVPIEIEEPEEPTEPETPTE